MNECKLLNAADGSVINTGDHICDWCFQSDSIRLMRSLDDRSLVDALLDFRSIFPRCTETLDEVSEWMRGRVGTGFRVTVELADGLGNRWARTVCLDADSAPLLDNSL